MKQITYELITHREKNRILIRFPHNKEWNERMKKTTDAQWSSTLKGWHIPDTPENRIACSIGQTKTLSSFVVSKPVSGISVFNKKEWRRYEEELKLKAYSPSTIKTYRNEFGIFLKYLGEKNADSCTAKDLRAYMLYILEEE